MLYKPKLYSCKGKVVIMPKDGRIWHGMIKLGYNLVSVYPNSGVMWENKGGTIIFRGKCTIGNDTYLSFGENTVVDFGDDFRNRAGAKIISYRGIKFGQCTSMGWGVLCMDTNFHSLYDIVTKEFKASSGFIEIGDYNWFGAQCKIMHSTITPERCIWGMGTIVTRGCVKKSYCLMGGSPVRILSENVMRFIGEEQDKKY